MEDHLLPALALLSECILSLAFSAWHREHCYWWTSSQDQNWEARAWSWQCDSGHWFRPLHFSPFCLQLSIFKLLDTCASSLVLSHGSRSVGTASNIALYLADIQWPYHWHLSNSCLSALHWCKNQNRQTASAQDHMPQGPGHELIKMFLWHGTVAKTIEMIAYQLASADDLSKTSGMLYSSSVPTHWLVAMSYPLAAVGSGFQIALRQQPAVEDRHWLGVKRIYLTGFSVRIWLAAFDGISQISTSIF